MICSGDSSFKALRNAAPAEWWDIWVSWN